MEQANNQAYWNDMMSFDPELDKTIRNLLEEAPESPSGGTLPSWCSNTPLNERPPTCASNADFAPGIAMFQDWQNGCQKIPLKWNSDQSVPTTGLLTPSDVASLKSDMGKELGSMPTSATCKKVSLEDIMELDNIAKECSVPELSRSSATSASVDVSDRASMSNYHSGIAACHAQHLSQLVNDAQLKHAGHSGPHALASSLSHAIVSAHPLGRPRFNSIDSTEMTGLTIQQCKRLSQAGSQTTSSVTTTRKRQMSAPGSCLPGTTSPEMQEAKLAQGHADALAASHKYNSKSCGLPAMNDEQDDWNDIVLANSPDMVFVLSLKGTVLYMSPSVQRILGYLAEEIVGRPLIDFCHPADIGPFCRELKESTTHLPQDDETSASESDTSKTHPRVDLIMRMSVKTGGYCLIETTGSLSVDPPRHRKVVVCSGRPQPIPMLPWDHVRGDLLNPEPSGWLKISHNGIFLGATGPIHQILCIQDINLVGHHLRDLPMVASSTDLLDALRSGKTISVQDFVDGASSQRAPVKLSVYPWTSDGRSNTAAFVHVQQKPRGTESTSKLPLKRKLISSEAFASSSPAPSDFGGGGLTGRMTSPCGGTHRVMTQGDAASTVFSELTGYHNGSWLVEMQKLQNVNKRLRHELLALTKRSAAASSKCHQLGIAV